VNQGESYTYLIRVNTWRKRREERSKVWVIYFNTSNTRRKGDLHAAFLRTHHVNPRVIRLGNKILNNFREMLVEERLLQIRFGAPISLSNPNFPIATTQLLVNEAKITQNFSAKFAKFY
jgi:hypothetical protein